MIINEVGTESISEVTFEITLREGGCFYCASARDDPVFACGQYNGNAADTLGLKSNRVRF